MNFQIKPLVTLSLRCYKRPERTRRMIECVMGQTVNNWELLLTGDNCPYFKEPEFIQFVKHYQRIAADSGNIIRFRNNQETGGGCGHVIINQHIGSANGHYFIFLSNDDIILPNHVANYTSFMLDNPDLKWAYFDTWVNPARPQTRDAQLKHGSIGHAELIVQTEFLRGMPFHGPEYGHDWTLIKNMMDKTTFYKKSIGSLPTYKVMGVPGALEQGID